VILGHAEQVRPQQEQSTVAFCRRKVGSPSPLIKKEGNCAFKRRKGKKLNKRVIKSERRKRRRNKLNKVERQW
jgi:hypothetical protein